MEQSNSYLFPPCPRSNKRVHLRGVGVIPGISEEYDADNAIGEDSSIGEAATGVATSLGDGGLRPRVGFGVLQ